MEAVAIKHFRHTNTGRVYAPGDGFVGTDAMARELARRGYVRVVSVETGGGEVQAAEDLQAMKVRDLVAICAHEGIETPAKPKKADLIAAIVVARGE